LYCVETGDALLKQEDMYFAPTVYNITNHYIQHLGAKLSENHEINHPKFN